MGRSRRVTYYRTPVDTIWRWTGAVVACSLVAAFGLRSLVDEASESTRTPGAQPVRHVTKAAKSVERPPPVGAINPKVSGPDDVPRQPHAHLLRGRARCHAARRGLRWRYPARRRMCSPVDRRDRPAHVVRHRVDGAAERDPAQGGQRRAPLRRLRSRLPLPRRRRRAPRSGRL